MFATLHRPQVGSLPISRIVNGVGVVLKVAATRATGTGRAAVRAAESPTTGNRDRTARSWDIIVKGW